MRALVLTKAETTGFRETSRVTFTVATETTVHVDKRSGIDGGCFSGCEKIDAANKRLAALISQGFKVNA